LYLFSPTDDSNRDPSSLLGSFLIPTAPATAAQLLVASSLLQLLLLQNDDDSIVIWQTRCNQQVLRAKKRRTAD